MVSLCYPNYGFILQDDYDSLWNVLAFLVAFVCCVCQVKSLSPHRLYCMYTVYEEVHCC